MDPAGPARLLEPALAAAVARVAATDRLLVASDFDGTLAPLVDDPTKARALPAAETALIRLAEADRTTVALVSGRSLASLRAGVARLADHAVLVGGHGIEREDDAPTPEETAALDAFFRPMDDAIDDIPGAWLERKPFSIVVHVRAVQPEERLGVLHRAARMAEEHGLHVLEGHAVLEALVRTPAKGQALESLRRSSRADSVVYLGDDVTDEDAFAALGPDDLGISIGPTPTRAAYRISTPRDAGDLLAVLADERWRNLDEPTNRAS
jgi:trehalose-phosphatase